MKKNVLFLGIALGALTLTSCKKEFSCNCHYDEFHDDHFDHKDIIYPLDKQSKKDAESKCEEKENLLKADPDHKEVHCDLKK